jgi:hypothetical protein
MVTVPIVDDSREVVLIKIRIMMIGEILDRILAIAVSGIFVARFSSHNGIAGLSAPVRPVCGTVECPLVGRIGQETVVMAA